jgi:acyl-coenzyme A synthetase/AMP-(fatty) acid ligase
VYIEVFMKVSSILSEIDLEREFVAGVCTSRDVMRLAEWLASELSGQDCAIKNTLLMAEDKYVLAAAIIAAAESGCPFLLPHALSLKTLSRVKRDFNTELAVLDRPRPIPDGISALLALSPEETKNISALKLSEADDEQVLLRLFTGGTTDAPCIQNKTSFNLFGEAKYLTKRFGIEPDDTIIAAVPPLHIYGLLFSVILPLISGARVVAETPLSPNAILQSAEEFHGNILVASPIHYKAMANGLSSTLPFRMAFSSGGFLDPRDARQFADISGLGINEVYGSTETGGIAVRCRMAGEEEWRPFDGVQVRYDEERLAVSSHFLSPNLSLDQDGFFVTGDRAIQGKGSNFQLLGRVDDIVKVGGKRIYLGEVREKFIHLPGVRDAYVMALPTESGRQNILAILVETEIDRQTLRKRAKKFLESSALPRIIRTVSSLPRQPSGKIDRELAIEILSEPSEAIDLSDQPIEQGDEIELGDQPIEQGETIDLSDQPIEQGETIDLSDQPIEQGDEIELIEIGEKQIATIEHHERDDE